MIECICDFCEKKEEFRERMIKGYEANVDKPWVCVSREPATFGHLLVASGIGYSGISDDRLARDPEHLKEMMRLISEITSKMNKNLKLNGRECEKVYVVTQCETRNLHLHFHLIPRFEGDNTGNIFLFEKELEEARWMLDSDEKGKVREACDRIAIAERILNCHKNLIRSRKWARPNEERKRFVQEIKMKVDEILGK